MRGVAVNTSGAAPELRDDLPAPTPGENEVLVRVRASSVNPVDAAIAGGLLEGMVEHDFSGRPRPRLRRCRRAGWLQRHPLRRRRRRVRVRPARDPTTPDALDGYAAALKPGGRAASSNGAAGDGPGRTNLIARPTPENLERLAGVLAAGTIAIRIQQSFPLAQAGRALQALATGHTQGKIAITID